MSKRKSGGSFSGKGYYIALILCAAAIGITGYLYYRNANDPQPQLQDPPASTGDVTPTKGKDVQAVATQPLQTDPQPTDPSQTTAPTTPGKPKKTVAPVTGQTVAEYAMDALSYNQTTRDWRVHNGIDIAAEAGTKVCAAADGTVYTIYQDETMGTTVVIRHDGGYITKYASLAEEVAVSAGDVVKAGDTIGLVGNSALLENAIGDHVHFSVTCDGEVMDPAKFLSQE